jgi:tight adherence protein B
MNIDWQRVAPPLAAAAAAFLVFRRAGAAADAPRVRPEGDASATALPLFAGLAVAFWLWRTDGRPWLAVAAAAVGYGLTMIWRDLARQRRDVADEAEALAVISAANRAMRAGMPLLAVLEAAAQESTGEAQAALREILQRERLGEDLANALRSVMQGVRQPELRAFGVALAVNQDVGGNLVATSERLSRAVIERGRTRRRARTIVAYARSAALALAGLPFAATILLGQMLPGYSDFLWRTTAGNAMAAVATVLMVIGLRSIQRLARIEGASARSAP